MSGIRMGCFAVCALLCVAQFGAIMWADHVHERARVMIVAGVR